MTRDQGRGRSAIFSRHHYEFLCEFAARNLDETQTEVLVAMLKADNPGFKPTLFEKHIESWKRSDLG